MSCFQVHEFHGKITVTGDNNFTKCKYPSEILSFFLLFRIQFFNCLRKMLSDYWTKVQNHTFWNYQIRFIGPARAFGYVTSSLDQSLKTQHRSEYLWSIKTIKNIRPLSTGLTQGLHGIENRVETGSCQPKSSTDRKTFSKYRKLVLCPDLSQELR